MYEDKIFFKFKGQKGYVALTSVIFMSLLLVTITVVLSIINYYSRYNILESEYKERSVAQAESCIDKAVYNVLTGVVVTYPKTYSDLGCTVESAVVAGSNFNVLVTGNYQASKTKLQVQLNSANNYKVVTWQELAN